MRMLGILESDSGLITKKQGINLNMLLKIKISFINNKVTSNEGNKGSYS